MRSPSSSHVKNEMALSAGRAIRRSATGRTSDTLKRMMVQAVALWVLALLWFSLTSPATLRAQTPGESPNLPQTAEATPMDSVSRQNTLIASVTIFVLAVFVGFEVITKVPPTLHTPLMSGSNAISGITLVGALLAAGTGERGSIVNVLGTAAVVMATINVVGGFLVTHRMLAMFRRN